SCYAIPRELHSFPTRRSSDLSYYRNFDRNWELNSELAPERIGMPSFFIAGDRDPVPGDDGTMKALLPDFRGSVIIPGVGHWTQRSEEHTSELQSPCNLVCRLL